MLYFGLLSSWNEEIGLLKSLVQDSNPIMVEGDESVPSRLPLASLGYQFERFALEWFCIAGFRGRSKGS